MSVLELNDLVKAIEEEFGNSGGSCSDWLVADGEKKLNLTLS